MLIGKQGNKGTNEKALKETRVIPAPGGPSGLASTARGGRAGPIKRARRPRHATPRPAPPDLRCAPRFALRSVAGVSRRMAYGEGANQRASQWRDRAAAAVYHRRSPTSGHIHKSRVMQRHRARPVRSASAAGSRPGVDTWCGWANAKRYDDADARPTRPRGHVALIGTGTAAPPLDQRALRRQSQPNIPRTDRRTGRGLASGIRRHRAVRWVVHSHPLASVRCRLPLGFGRRTTACPVPVQCRAETAGSHFFSRRPAGTGDEGAWWEFPVSPSGYSSIADWLLSCAHCRLQPLPGCFAGASTLYCNAVHIYCSLSFSPGHKKSVTNSL